MKKQTALMNHWQLCQYLRKLHLPQVVPPPDLATLKLLQDAHLKYVCQNHYEKPRRHLL